MKTIVQSNIKYENPPIDEIVCDILFDSIKDLRTGHFGILWEKFRPDFPEIEDHILLAPVPEDLETPNKLLLPRIWFVHKNENEVVQVQQNRFIHNWRKRQPDDEYPGYEKVIENFERYLSRFQQLLAEENLGNLVARKYELTYIDLIPEGQGWENFDDLEKIFPNLLSLTKQNIFSTGVRGINWQTILNLPNNLGQLQMSIRNGWRVSSDHPLLNIEFKAFSNHPHEPMPDEPIRDWFNAAHDTIIKLFSNLISDEIQEKFWGRKPC